jgi:5-methyltetrahydrofolate--homocysteine methyltransferase
MEILREIAESLGQGEDEKVAALARAALEGGAAAREVLERALIAGMADVGERFRRHEIFLPDVLLAARAMNAGVEVLKPHLAGEGVPSRGKVVIGTIQGDLHDIGKNLVGIMLRGAGFEVIDLGHDVSPERFVDVAERDGAGVVGMSALLTTTMQGMAKVVDLLQRRGLAGKVKTIVGGAPVSGEFAREIGADAHGYDAANAVERVSGLFQAIRNARTS